MNKQLPIFTFLLLFPILLFSKNENYDLASSAGTMILDEINHCVGDNTFIPHNGDETLDAGDVIKAVIHDNSGMILGNIFGDQIDINGFIGVEPQGITLGNTYYISAIAGMDDGTGNVDLTDPEISVAEGTPIIFVGPLETYLFETICEGEVINVNTNVYSETGIYTINLISAQGCDSVIILDLTVLDPQAAIFPVTEVIDCSGTPITVSALVTNTNPAISYVWSGPCFTQNFPQDPNINVTCGGIYILEVHHTENGVTCISETVSVEVFENTTPPVVDAGPDLFLDCSTLAVTPNAIVTPANSTYAYSWTGANGFTSSSQFPTFTSVGTFCFFAIDLTTSCISNTDCINVTGNVTPPIAVATVSNDLTCVNPSAVISATGSSTGINIVYEWLDANGISIGTSFTMTVSTPGDYILQVTDANNGCFSSTTVTVLEDWDAPVAAISSSGDIDCNNDSVTLDASPSAGNNLDYLWSTAENSISIEAFFAGTYTLTVTDLNNGCTDETSIVVDDTNTYQVDIGEDTFFPCDVSEMLITGNSIPTGTGFTYLWTTMDGTIASGEDTIEPSISSPGTYVLTVDDAVNGCTGTDEIVIYDFNDLLSVTENLTLNCVPTVPNELEASLLLSNLDVSYAWTTTSGNFTSTTDIINPTVDAAGVYVLAVTDNLTGCTATGSVTMENPTLPTVVIESQGSSVFDCNNTVVILDGSNSTVTPPAFFEWSTGGSILSTSTIVTVTAAGFYELVVTDVNGCSSSESYLVTDDSNPPDFTLPSEVMLNCNNNFEEEVGAVLVNPNQNVAYEWLDNIGNVLSTDSSFIFSGNSSVGLYFLKITDLDNGCSSFENMVVSYDGFAIDVTTTPAGCDLEDGTATASTVLSNSLVCIVLI